MADKSVRCFSSELTVKDYSKPDSAAGLCCGELISRLPFCISRSRGECGTLSRIQPQISQRRGGETTRKIDQKIHLSLKNILTKFELVDGSIR